MFTSSPTFSFLNPSVPLIFLFFYFFFAPILLPSFSTHSSPSQPSLFCSFNSHSPIRQPTFFSISIVLFPFCSLIPTKTTRTVHDHNQQPQRPTPKNK